MSVEESVFIDKGGSSGRCVRRAGGSKAQNAISNPPFRSLQLATHLEALTNRSLLPTPAGAVLHLRPYPGRASLYAHPTQAFFFSF